MTDSPSESAVKPAPVETTTRPRDARRGRDPRSPRPNGAPRSTAARPARSHPVLEQLAGFYPRLFGAVVLPLKRGIFHDLLAAHPGAFTHEALKEALGLHTRSTPYLKTVAAGEKRRDLLGQPVEDMAPEHVYQALLEVFRRRRSRGHEDLGPKLRNRMVLAFEASGLSRQAYAQLVHSRDEAANQLLDEALADVAARAAKDEALLRAFDASGQTVDAFADMYGMDPRAATRMLERARRALAAASD